MIDENTMVCYKNEPIYRHNGEMARRFFRRSSRSCRF